MRCTKSIARRIHTPVITKAIISLLNKGLLRCGITVWLDFGKKYDAELRTEFLEKVRYGNTVLYFSCRTVQFPYSSNTRFALCFQVLHFSFLSITLPRQLRSPLTTHHRSPVTISNSNIVNKLNCYAMIVFQLFNHNPAYNETSSSNSIR